MYHLSKYNVFLSRNEYTIGVNLYQKKYFQLAMKEKKKYLNTNST